MRHPFPEHDRFVAFRLSSCWGFVTDVLRRRGVPMEGYADRWISSQSPIKSLIRDLGAALGSHKRRIDRPKLAEQLSEVRESGLFDTSWYLRRNPDVAKAKVDPLVHYLEHGGFEGRDPNSAFSSRAYLAEHPHLASTGVSPLYHYVLNRPAVPAPVKASRTAERAKAPLPVPASLVPALPWKAIVKESLESGRLSQVLGVACPRGEAALRFELIRVDEDIQGDRLSSAAGYLFDVPASDSRFGWEGTMTPANNLANEALVRHLRAVRAAKLPTVLVYDAATLSRPFYKDLQSLFSVHIDRRSLAGDEILPGPFATLCKRAA